MNLCSKKEQTKNCASEKIQKCDEKKNFFQEQKKYAFGIVKKKMKSPQEKRKVFFLSFFEKSEFVQFILKIVQKKEEILFEKIP